MLVYRIENSAGFGPYRQNIEENPNPHNVNMSDFDSLGSSRPIPFCDGIGKYNEKDYFGFDSLDSLIAWFDNLLPSLEDYGYCVSIYEIDPTFVKFGRHQVAFERARATLVDRLAPQSCPF
jgi:hypothetical protein